MDSLSKKETVTLEQCEEVIERNLEGFQEAGRALLRIRDERLYKGQYKTFEEYCQKRWEFSDKYAHRLIGATQAMDNLSPIGDKTEQESPKVIPMPKTETQARPLTKLKTPEAQREAWTEAFQTAPEGKVTAKHVEEVVKRKTQKKEPEIFLPGGMPREEMKAVDCVISDLQSTYRYVEAALEKTSFSDASQKRIIAELDAIAKKVKGMK